MLFRSDAEGLAGLCRREGIRAIVDAAHPYAVAAHAAAAAAAARLGIPCLTFRRPTIFTADNGRSPHTGNAVIPGGKTTPAPAVGHSSGPDRRPGCPTAATDVSDRGSDRMTLPADVKDVTTPNRPKKPGRPRWPSGGAGLSPSGGEEPSPGTKTQDEGSPIRFAADHGEAARLAFADGHPVLLTTGSRNLAPYAAEARRTGVPMAARVLDAPESLAACAAAGIPAERIIAARGPFSTAENQIGRAHV